MSTKAELLLHPINQSREQAWSGFSWPCLFFGVFWFLYKQMYVWSLISFLLALVTGGFSWLLFPFFANGLHRNGLLKQGYLTLEQARAQQERSLRKPLQEAPARASVAEELARFSELHKSGVISADEFAAQKRKLLA